jgi:hypothetical protein
VQPPPVPTPPTPIQATPARPSPAVNTPDWKAEFDQSARSPDKSRLTTEAVREERLSRMRAQDPVLDAAVRELDLDLLD